MKPAVANKAFSTILPALQLAWDSVSSGLLKECPRKYQLSIVKGWTTREQSVDLTFGIFFHEGCETYHVARAKGLSHDDAVCGAVDYLLRATWDNVAERPWQGDERKNRFTLTRTLVWYLDKWENDPLVTQLYADGRPMVEVSFRFELPLLSSTNEHFMLCGHLDRVASYAESQLWINDRKTTKSSLDEASAGYFFSNFSPDNQVSLYTFAGQVVLDKQVSGVMLDGAQVAHDFSRFARAPITRTPAQVNEWAQDFLDLLSQADRYARNGYWPMNDKSCFRCPFRPVCSLPSAERAGKLERDYVRRVWDPLDIRGK